MCPNSWMTVSRMEITNPRIGTANVIAASATPMASASQPSRLTESHFWRRRDDGATSALYGARSGATGSASDSADGTAGAVERAGARVVNWRDVDPRQPVPGKGEALWRGVKAARGEVVVFVDADVVNAQPWWVPALAAPLADR